MTKVLQEISFDEELVAETVYVSFAIRSDVLDPKAITNLLGIQPSRAWAKGEQYLGKVFDPATKQVTQVWRPRYSGIWAIESKGMVESKRAEAHALYLLNLLEPAQEQLKHFLNLPETYTVRFYIRWEPKSGHGSYELSSSTLSKMTALCHYTEFSFIS